MNIRFLYFKGCPNAEPALELLKQIIQENGLNEKIEVIEIITEQDAQKYNFLGSPSIQINGLDIEKEKRNDPPVFGCRIYKTKDGYSGVPPKDMIINALTQAVNKKG
ncbi:MAG: DF family (seleno)protein [bacterium]